MAAKHRHSTLRLFLTVLRARFRNGVDSSFYKTKYRQWKFRDLSDRFTPRTKDEAYHILHKIPMHDEYGITHKRFARSDVIIDIGAHVGVFSYMAQTMGSRNVHAFEADPTNFSLLKNNLHGLRGIHLSSHAVSRSDAEAPPHVIHSGYIGENTGGGNVIMGGRPFEFWKQELLDAPPAPTLIPTIRLDDILARFESVKLIKIDCEGSEFPILLTSRLLGRVERIVGEYHEIEPPMMPNLDPGAVIKGYTSYQKEHLAAALQAHGFHVTFLEYSHCLGLFNATRPKE